MPAQLDDVSRWRLAVAIREAHADRNAGRCDDTWAAALRRADDIAEKMDLIGAELVSLDVNAAAAGGEVTFTSTELDRLSRHEHGRWMREKLETGWTLGPVVDPVARTHPCLVGYDRLPEMEKEKDREQVGRIPALLRAAGLGVARRDSRP